MWKLRPLLGILLLALAGGSVWYLSMQGYSFDLAMLKEYRMDIHAALMDQYYLGVLIFGFVYVLAVTLSLPIASLLTVLSGFLFGSIVGTVLVAGVATVGATCALLLNRYFFREFVVRKFGDRLSLIDAELSSNGLRDIFIVRLTPIFPFSLVTIAASLTNMKVRDFIVGTFFGILPFTFIYVHAGTQLANVDSFSDIVSFPVLAGLSLLILAVSAPFILRRKRGGERDTL